MRLIVVAILWLFSCVVFANNLESSTTSQSKPNETLSEHEQTKATSFSQQLGLVAINIPEMLSGQQQTLQLTPSIAADNNLNNTTLYSRDGAWFNKNETAGIWLGRIITDESSFASSSHIMPTQGTSGLNAAINVGRFSAETALFTNGDSVFDSEKFYLQGSYTFLEKDSFNLAITAKLETLSSQGVGKYLGEDIYNFKADSVIKHQAKNATLGLVGTFELAPNWTVMGALTSTTIDKDIQKSPLINSNYVNMALIGTSYSF